MSGNKPAPPADLEKANAAIRAANYERFQQQIAKPAEAAPASAVNSGWGARFDSLKKEVVDGFKDAAGTLWDGVKSVAEAPKAAAQTIEGIKNGEVGIRLHESIDPRDVQMRREREAGIAPPPAGPN